MFRCLILVCAIGVLLSFPASVWADAAQEAFAKGQALFNKGDLDGALASFATAARIDRTNDKYMERYSVVRRIVALRQSLQAEADAERWLYLARALYALYCQEGMLSDAAALAQAIHGKLNDVSSAVILAETQLALGQNAEAAKVLSALGEHQSTASSRALLGIALARQGNLDRARKISDSIVVAEGAGPQTHYSLARLYALTADPAKALSALTRCMESLAPSRQESFREHARRCPDFAGLASTPGFVKALATPSKVPESACSGGSGCAGCPMRGKCAESCAQQGK
mgnify:CR=1 FL=1